jgi:hypothetical protein
VLLLTEHHAMKAYCEWRYSSTHSLTSALDGREWSASRPARFTPRKRAPDTHWAGGWVGPRSVLDAVVKRKIPTPRRESNPRTPIIQPVTRRYTDWAITALQRIINSLKLKKIKKACGTDGIQNEYLWHLPQKPIVYLTHLFKQCLRLSHFPQSWKDANVITLPKPGKDPKFPQNLRPISLLLTTGKIFDKIILRIIQRHIEVNNTLNPCKFGFRALHSATLQCTRLTDHVTLNFNNMSTVAVS